MAAEEKARVKLELTTWIKRIESARDELLRVRNNPRGTQVYQGVDRALDELRDVHKQMALVRRDMVSLVDLLGVMKRDADLKAVIVNAYPKNVVADRMTYLGAALLGAGSAAFAFFGLPTEVGAALIPPGILWGFGILLLSLGLWSLSRWEAHRWAYFREQFDVPEIGSHVGNKDGEA